MSDLAGELQEVSTISPKLCKVALKKFPVVGLSSVHWIQCPPWQDQVTSPPKSSVHNTLCSHPKYSALPSPTQAFPSLRHPTIVGEFSLDAQRQFVNNRYMCSLDTRCVVDNRCTLGNRWTVGNRCTLGSRCTLGYRCTLDNNCTLGNMCTQGNRCTLGNMCTLGNKVYSR